MSRSLLFCLCVFLSPNLLEATHTAGGELTFRCVGGGRYVFKVVYYRDCTGGPEAPTSLQVNFTNPNGSISGSGVSGSVITCNRIGVGVDISPKCTVTLGGPDSIFCANGVNASSRGYLGAISQWTYESAPVDFNAILAPLAGIPYIFVVTNVPCCRNINRNLAACGSMAFRAYMYSYVQNGVPIPPALLCDNSASFQEPPSTLQVVNSADTAVFHNNAIDVDRDSIAYAIDVPWTSGGTSGTPCAYSGGFSVTNPFPGIIFNGPLQPINLVTGVIEFRPMLAGNYVACIRIESWRCGQKISEVFRDFPLQILNLPMNYPRVGSLPSQQTRPDITKPFPNPITHLRNQSYSATYFVGDTVRFEMTALDLDFFPAQRVKLFYSGIGFSSDASRTQSIANDCAYPPCAYLETPNAVKNPPNAMRGRANNIVGYGYEGNAAVAARFIWPTDCSNNVHIGCPNGNRKSIYRYAVTASDDQCPVNGKTIQSIEINLLPLPILAAPILHKLTTLNQNTIKLDWTQPMDLWTKEPSDKTLSESVARRFRSFDKYFIFRSDAVGGGFILIDSIADINRTTYIDSTVLGGANSYFYKIRTLSSCNSNWSTCSNQLATSLEPNFSNYTSLIYPNPSKDYFTINVLVAEVESVLRIFTVEGKLVEIHCIQENNFEFGKDYPLGIYFAELQMKDKKVIQKIIKTQ